MPRIIFSEYVEPELTAIWEFIALDNMDAADRFFRIRSCHFSGISADATHGIRKEVSARTIE
jgi:plasmid stabilization system protein ParE